MPAPRINARNIRRLTRQEIEYVLTHARVNPKARTEWNSLFGLSRAEKPRTYRWHLDLAAVRGLKPGQGVKFPCRWQHPLISGRLESGWDAMGRVKDRVGNECPGKKSARNAAKSEGFQIVALCEEGVLRVVRVDS